ncbi:Ankyrin repeat-containing protein P16F5.05c, partial [Linum perenne]
RVVTLSLTALFWNWVSESGFQLFSFSISQIGHRLSVKKFKMAGESIHLQQQHCGAGMTQSPEEIVEVLLEAARYDDIDDILSLVSSGVPLDSKDSFGRTALHMASANGHLRIVQYLIDQGVDLNASNEEKNTALHWACLNGHSEVVKKLILAGASLCALNSYERTPMDEAVTRGKMDAIDAINAAVAQMELAGVTVS